MGQRATTTELDATPAAALPTISNEGKRLARRVARLLATGEPLDIERISAALGQPGSEVEEAIVRGRGLDR